MAKRKPADVLNLSVSFGGISIGNKTAKIGFSISREKMTLAAVGWPHLP